MWCVIGYVHVLFGENRFAKLSVVDKILRAVVSTICRPKHNFSDLFPPKYSSQEHYFKSPWQCTI